MARIRSRGKRDTELALARLLRAHGITGWRRQVPISGRARHSVRAAVLKSQNGAHGVTRPAFRVRPDFVFPKHKLAVFVEGCFWHGCPRHATQPKGNAAFWRNKISRNQARDRIVSRTLRRTGWRVLRIWEHELAKKNEARLLRRIQRVFSGAI